MLKCSKCGGEKPESEFYERPGSKRGYRYCCKGCQFKRSQKYRKTHSGSVREQQSRWRKANPGYHLTLYKANPEKYREKARKWRKANPGKVRVTSHKCNRKRYKLDPEKYREKARKYYKANLEKCRESTHKWRKANPQKMRKYKREYNRSERGLSLHKKYTELLVDCYVRTRLKQTVGLELDQITPEMIGLKREQILFYRELKKVKGVTKWE